MTNELSALCRRCVAQLRATAADCEQPHAARALPRAEAAPTARLRRQDHRPPGVCGLVVWPSAMLCREQVSCSKPVNFRFAPEATPTVAREAAEASRTAAQAQSGAPWRPDRSATSAARPRCISFRPCGEANGPATALESRTWHAACAARHEARARTGMRQVASLNRLASERKGQKANGRQQTHGVELSLLAQARTDEKASRGERGRQKEGVS